MQKQQLDFSSLVNAAQAGIAKMIASFVLAMAFAAAVRFLLKLGGRHLDALGRFLFMTVFGFTMIGLLYVAFALDTAQPPGQQDVFGPFVMLAAFAAGIFGAVAMGLAVLVKGDPPAATARHGRRTPGAR
ncbi:hypothetical protein ACVIGB_000763 [Bradyrhizobium sp. USDA 4341]